MFEAALRPVGKRRGRPTVVGVRLANPPEVARLPTTRWQRSQLLWYWGTTDVVDWVAGTALWYSTGTKG